MGARKANSFAHYSWNYSLAAGGVVEVKQHGNGPDDYTRFGGFEPATTRKKPRTEIGFPQSMRKGNEFI